MAKGIWIQHIKTGQTIQVKGRAIERYVKSPSWVVGDINEKGKFVPNKKQEK